MKKLFTLTAALLVAAIMFAASPTVVINNRGNDYEVTIDGKTYSNGNGTIRVNDLNSGRHTVRVYQKRSGIFRTRKLIDTETFDLSTNDNVRINVDANGNIDVRESLIRQRDDRRDRDDRRWEDRDDDRRDNRHRGRGHKYGHNKEWKKYKDANKNKNKKRDRDDRDWDDD